MKFPLSRLLLCTCIALTSLSVSAQSFGQTITVPTSTTPVFGIQPFTSTTSTNTSAGNILVSQDIYTNASAGSSSNYYFINNFSNYSCGLGYYRHGSRCYTCLGVPDDAYHTSPNTCTWSCNSGYYRSGNACIANNPYPQPQPYPYPTQPSTSQCGQTLNTCASGLFYDANDIGNFAYWICVGNNSAPVSCAAYKTITTPPPVQSCGIGQYPINNSCQTCFSKPNNSNYTTANSCDWACVGGYHRESNTCVADYIPTPQPQQCGIGQYPINNSCQTCFSKPQNSNYTTPNTCDWSCMSGYQREGNSCISVVATCGIGQYPIGNSCQSCFSKPMNSNYTTSNSCDWACVGGYHREANTCVADYIPTQPSCYTDRFPYCFPFPLGTSGSVINPPLATSCKDILESGSSTGSGVYTVRPQGQTNSVLVYCDMITDGGGWMLVSSALASSELGTNNFMTDTSSCTTLNASCNISSSVSNTPYTELMHKWENCPQAYATISQSAFTNDVGACINSNDVLRVSGTTRATATALKYWNDCGAAVGGQHRFMGYYVASNWQTPNAALSSSIHFIRNTTGLVTFNGNANILNYSCPTGRDYLYMR